MKIKDMDQTLVNMKVRHFFSILLLLLIFFITSSNILNILKNVLLLHVKIAYIARFFWKGYLVI